MEYNMITQEMVDKLNQIYEDAVFEFTFSPAGYGLPSVDIKLKKKYDKYIDSYILNLREDTLEDIRTYFSKLNVKIHYNNVASCFWSVPGE